MKVSICVLKLGTTASALGVLVGEAAGPSCKSTVHDRIAKLEKLLSLDLPVILARVD